MGWGGELWDSVDCTKECNCILELSSGLDWTGIVKPLCFHLCWRPVLGVSL